MIHLVNTSKIYRGAAGTKVVLRPTAMSLPSHRRVGVLGHNGAGKSTLLNLVAGIDTPSSGSIIRDCRLSWPLGFSGGFHPDLTGAENIAFVARIYKADVSNTIAFVEDFAEIGSYIAMPVRTYSQGMRARLAFGLSMAIDFDCYLVDEITGVGDASFQKKCRQAFLDRAERSGMLFVSHSERTIRQYCELALVFYDGYLIPFDDLDEAIRFYTRTSG